MVDKDAAIHRPKMKFKAQCENATEILSNDQNQILEQVLPVHNELPLSLGQA